jgi:uncharacterized damage-inducible protein DinB
VAILRAEVYGRSPEAGSDGSGRRGFGYGGDMNASLLVDAFDHHVWATVRLIDACLPLDEAQLATTVPGTYGSIIDTLRHTVAADRGYLTLLSGGRVPDVDESTLDLPALRTVMDEDGPVWSEVLGRDLDPQEIVVRHRPDGSQSAAPLGIRLAQVVHHGTDHRSQICTALTSLGIEPPAIDVWDFAWTQDRLTETAAPA